MRYVISYDLRIGATPDDYTRITTAIESLGGRRVLLSQFALRSDSTANQILNYLLPFIDRNDRLLVTEFTNNWASYNAMIDLNTV